MVTITEFNLRDIFEVGESNQKKRREEGGNKEIKLFKEISNITDEGVHHDKVKDANACGNKYDWDEELDNNKSNTSWG